jgi:ferredoxin-NADP reductase
MAHTVKILATEMLNHNVKRFTTERPQGLNYTPGQAVLVEIPEMKGKNTLSRSPVCSLRRSWNLPSSCTMITMALRTV